MNDLPQNDHHYNIDPIGDRFGPTAPWQGLRPQRAFSVIADTNDADIGRQQTPHSTKLIGHEPLTTYDVTLELKEIAAIEQRKTDLEREVAERTAELDAS